MRRVEGFYDSTSWKKVREAYKEYAHGLCERCWADGRIEPGVIVHHKIHLTEDNKADPNIAYSFDNLELLCLDCHNKEHFKKSRRYRVDALGRVIT